MKVITFSRQFPVKHPKAGQPTFFVEQIYNAIGFKIGVTKRTGDIPELMWEMVNDFVLLDGGCKKYHTIRAGNRWKVGDWFSPRIWSAKPYASKQIEFAPPIQIKKIWPVEIETDGKHIVVSLIAGKHNPIQLPTYEVAKNDGLDIFDFKDWFTVHPKRYDLFQGQILCWNEHISYCQ